VSVDMSLDGVHLIAALEHTTDEISHLLDTVADDQDWRPNDEHWSFRHIAAHLEACQTECVLVRVRQIAAGAKPTFEFYDNDDGTSATETFVIQFMNGVRAELGLSPSFGPYRRNVSRGRGATARSARSPFSTTSRLTSAMTASISRTSTKWSENEREPRPEAASRSHPRPSLTSRVVSTSRTLSPVIRSELRNF